jgi:hypothetical protein
MANLLTCSGDECFGSQARIALEKEGTYPNNRKSLAQYAACRALLDVLIQTCRCQTCALHVTYAFAYQLHASKSRLYHSPKVDAYFLRIAVPKKLGPGNKPAPACS